MLLTYHARACPFADAFVTDESANIGRVGDVRAPRTNAGAISTSPSALHRRRAAQRCIRSSLVVLVRLHAALLTELHEEQAADEARAARHLAHDAQQRRRRGSITEMTEPAQGSQLAAAQAAEREQRAAEVEGDTQDRARQRADERLLATGSSSERARSILPVARRARARWSWSAGLSRFTIQHPTET